MKILHIITSLGNGGAERTLYRLVMNDESNDYYVISLLDRGVYGEALAQLGVPVYTLDMSRGRWSFSAFIKILEILREVGPDVVQTWMYHSDLLGGVASRLSGIRSVFWGIRGPFDREKTGFTTKLVVWVCSLLSYWVPQKIVSNSHYALLAHERVGYKKEKLVHIANGYDFNDIEPDRVKAKRIREEFLTDSDSVLLGMVARFDPYKDHENLLEALCKIKSRGCRFTCLLVGSGLVSGNGALSKRIENFGLEKEVRLLGPRLDIPNIMGAMDVHVLSSVAESFPNVLAEAMLCGTPCVSTDAGDAALIVGNTGWIVPPRNSELLAKGIELAIFEMKNIKQWQQRRSACRERIKDHYSLEKMVDKYIEIWNGEKDF